jgi:ubiquinone/menaquinone biosynthesis C-methylase UbiE
MYQDKINDLIKSNVEINLELGCGAKKRHINALGIDLLPEEGVDFIGDIFVILKQFPDKVVDNVWSYHFFEHIESTKDLLNELARVCKYNAKITITVPHFSNPYYYSDPTHRTHFGLYTMSYFCEDGILSRSVPKYGVTPKFKIESVTLCFRSFRPRYIRHAIKKILQAIVNINSWSKEFYEEVFAFIFPCYELSYNITKLQDGN